MRHRKHNITFGRQKSHYKATMRMLVSGLIINKSITTTKVRAKETSRLADKLVTLGKENTVTNMRAAFSILHDKELVAILFKEIAPLFKDRLGGYTRVILTGKRRKGDNTEMALLEFVEKPVKEPVVKKEKKKKEKPSEPEQEVKVDEQENIVQPKIEPKRQKEIKSKPGFFKKFFGRKQGM